MKKYTKLTDGYYRDYDKKDFLPLFGLFLDWQKENQIEKWHVLTKDMRGDFVLNFLLHEFQKLLRQCPMKYVIVDKETEEIVIFVCFSLDKFFASNTKMKSVDLMFSFKNLKYHDNLYAQNIFLEILKNLKNKHKRDVFATLDKRKNFEVYKKWMHRRFNLENIYTNQFDVEIVKFNLDNDEEDAINDNYE